MTPEIFLSLSEPVRLNLIKALCDQTEAMTPTLLAAKLGVRPSVISHHLVKLQDAGLVISIPSGRNTLYLPNGKILLELSFFFSALHKGA